MYETIGLTIWLTGGAEWRADRITMARNSKNASQIRRAEPLPVQPVLGGSGASSRGYKDPNS